MSLDLYEKETAERMTGLQPVQSPESSAFDGFARGTPKITMEFIAKGWRAASMTAGAVPVIIDAFTGGTELQDKYFKFHDDFFGSAVDYWTPRPGEVGAAGQIVGTALGLIPLVAASPAAAVGITQMSVTEDLARQGVDPAKAIGVGAVQAVGLGVGIYVPIFGKSLWQRTLLGGAGFNVVQGAAMRGASGQILEGTPAADEYKAFDSEAMTLDLLMGAAFGAVSHLSPAQRAEGERAWKKLEEWGQRLKPSDVEGLAVLRQAQHANVDSLPGKPVDVTDVTAHTDRLKTAIEQLLRDEPVNVSDMPAGRFDPVPERFPEAEARVQTLMAEAERIRVEEGLPEIGDILPDMAPSRGPGDNLTDSKPPQPESEVVGVINESWTPPQRLSEAFERSGFKVRESGSSRSGSRYVEIEDSISGELVAIRFSDHEITSNAITLHGNPDIQIGTFSGADVASLDDSLQLIFAKINNGRANVGDLALTSEEMRRISASLGVSPSQSPRSQGAGIPDPEGPPLRTEPPLGEVAARPSDQMTEAKPGGERPDPLALEAQRFADDNPDLPITVGRDTDGKPITKSVREYLDETRAEADLARQDIRLFEIAASCILGAM